MSRKLISRKLVSRKAHFAEVHFAESSSRGKLILQKLIRGNSFRGQLISRKTHFAEAHFAENQLNKKCWAAFGGTLLLSPIACLVFFIQTLP